MLSLSQAQQIIWLMPQLSCQLCTPVLAAGNALSCFLATAELNCAPDPATMLQQRRLNNHTSCRKQFIAGGFAVQVPLDGVLVDYVNSSERIPAAALQEMRW